MKEIRMEDIEAYFDQVEALEAERDSLRKVVQAVEALRDKWRQRAHQSGEAVDYYYADEVAAALAAAARAVDRPRLGPLPARDNLSSVRCGVPQLGCRCVLPWPVACCSTREAVTVVV